jgi:hypothetical protein
MMRREECGVDRRDILPGAAKAVYFQGVQASSMGVLMAAKTAR